MIEGHRVMMFFKGSKCFMLSGAYANSAPLQPGTGLLYLDTFLLSGIEFYTLYILHQIMRTGTPDLRKEAEEDFSILLSNTNIKRVA